MTTLLRQLAQLAVGLGLAVFLARSLGREGNGLVATALLLPGLLAAFGTLGLASSNVYFVGRGDVSARVALRVSLALVAALALPALCAVALLLPAFGQSWFPGVPAALLWIALLAALPMLASPLLASLLQGLEDFRGYNRALLSGPAATLGLALLGVGVFGGGAEAALLAWVGGAVVGLVHAFALLRRHLRVDAACSALSFSRYARCALGYGWKAQLGNSLMFLNYRADLFLVGWLLSPAATGVYVVAVQIAERLSMPSQALSAVLLPRLSALHRAEAATGPTGVAERSAPTPLAARLVLWSAGLAACAVAVLAGPVVAWLFGAEFADASRSLAWLLPGAVALAVARVLASDLAARGRVDLNLWASAVVLAVNVPANLILIPREGIAGAAMATSLAYGLNLLLSLVFYARVSGNPWWSAVAPPRANRGPACLQDKSAR